MEEYAGNTQLGTEIINKHLTGGNPDPRGISRTVTAICRQEIEQARQADRGLYLRNLKEQILGFMQLDYELVHREILDIKQCRTNIFMGTLGVLGAGAVAMLLGVREGMAAGEPAGAAASWEAWLPLAALIPTVLLLCAILSTIHKARGINERAGYMEAIGEYIRFRRIPLSYMGWIKAMHVQKRCRIYKCKGVKPGGDPTCKKEDSCRIQARTITKAYGDSVNLKPSLLDDFTSLSTHIYSCAFLVSVVTLLFTTLYAIKGQIRDFSAHTYWMSAMYGGGITAIFFLLAAYSRSHATRPSEGPRPSQTRTERVFQWYRWGAAIALPAVVLGYIFCNDGDMVKGILAYGIGATIAVAAGATAASLLDKVRSLRRGRYSSERWRYVWMIRLKGCPLMKEETVI